MDSLTLLGISHHFLREYQPRGVQSKNNRTKESKRTVKIKKTITVKDCNSQFQLRVTYQPVYC